MAPLRGILAAGQPRIGTSVKPAPAAEALPTDEELAVVADPVAVFAGLRGDRSRDRDAVVAHVFGSVHVTDELVWRLPVREIERSGPRLAAKVAEICGNSPRRWQAFGAA